MTGIHMDQYNPMDELLVSYLLGEATPQQKQQVEAWIAASDENRKYYNQFSRILEESRALRPASQVSEDAAWMRLVQRAEADLAQQQQAMPGARIIPFYQRTWVRVAAMLIVLAGVGITLFTQQSSRSSMVVVSSGNTPLTDTLPDGSVIVLNRNSTLQYARAFTGSQRNVTLTGEAFFQVAPDKQKPFVINANNTTVTVVGTSFNVKTSPRRTEVIVETGIVQVARRQQQVRLTPHQRTVIDSASAPVATTSADELYSYYRTGRFVCNATPLHKLADVLGEAYDVNIVIANAQLAAMPITTTFTREPVDDIIKVVAATLNISTRRVGNTIYLEPHTP